MARHLSAAPPAAGGGATALRGGTFTDRQVLFSVLLLETSWFDICVGHNGLLFSYNPPTIKAMKTAMLLKGFLIQIVYMDNGDILWHNCADAQNDGSFTENLEILKVCIYIESHLFS